MIWHLLLLSFMFILAGIFHFIKPKFYLKIMPPYIPYPMFAIYTSGFTEVVSGILLLFAETQKFGAILIIMQLIAFFSVHIHMLLDEKMVLKMGKPALWIRLALQFGLIFWAYQYV